MKSKISLSQLFELFSAKIVNLLFAIIYSSLLIQGILTFPQIYFYGLIKTKVFFCIVVACYVLTGLVIIKTRKKNYQYVFIISAFIWAILQVFYLWVSWSEYNSDAWYITTTSFSLAHGISLDEGSIIYFSTYTNNTPALLLETVLFTLLRFVPSYQYATICASIVAGILADVTICYIVRCVKLLSNSTQVHYLTFLASIILIGLSEQATVLYTDILALWTIPFSIFHMQKASKRGLDKHICLAGIALAYGIWMKPQVAVFLVAFVILQLVNIINKKKSKLSLVFVAAVALSILQIISSAFLYCFIAPKEYVEAHKFSLYHFINMGLNSETVGGYSLKDVETMQSIEGSEAKKTYATNEICNRLKELGITGLLRHLNKKAVRATYNGTFTDGDVWRGALLNHGKLAKLGQRWLLPISDRPNYWATCVAPIIMATYWGIFASAIAATIRETLKGRTISQDKLLFLCTTACIGIYIFILLFECNSRYLYTFLPLLIIVGIGKGFCQFISYDKK